MKKQDIVYKGLFLSLFFLLAGITIYALKSSEPPRLVLFLGRFHPLLLHLPIGVLVVTFFIDIQGRFQKDYPIKTVQSLLGFTSFFSIATCFLGYFLSLERGYAKETLDLHFYTGILTAVLNSGLFIFSLQSSFEVKKTFLFLFLTSLISISIAGHLGSVLTHGDAFLTEYASAPEKDKTIEVVDSLRLYEDVIGKILEDKCIQCHNSTKKKGELSLLSKAAILKGGVNGSSVIRGDVLASSLHARLILPMSNEEHMPPEGKVQLTSDEIWLVEHWIKTGADFENYVANVAENDTLKTILEKYLVFNKVELPRAAKSAVESVQKAGFRVLEIVPGEAALDLKFLGKKPNKILMDELALLSNQVVELDFNSEEITDEMVEVIRRLKNLRHLRLNSPKITDKALMHLYQLENLEVINLYNTQITSNGLKELLNFIQPKTVYTWSTKVDQTTAQTLASNLGISIQNNILDGFVEESRLEVPDVVPNRTLFTDTLHLQLKSRLKEVDLRYTLNGKTPDTLATIFKDKIILDHSTTLKIKAFKDNWLPSNLLQKEYVKVKYQISEFRMKEAPDERYPNPEKLFDLKEGSLTFSDGKWVGYFGNDLETTIDLGESKVVDQLSFRCLEDVRSWILYPQAFVVYTSDTKNGPFKKLGELKISREGEGGDPESKKVTLKTPETQARYFKLHIKNHKILPDWHPSAGNPSWIFVDEIYFW